MQIEFRNIHKQYGRLKANKDISFSISSGTIHGVLGENGAGKSTLMKILAGFCRKTSGKVLINNYEVAITSPAKASQIGIGMLYQDPMDFDNLTVLENFILERKSKAIIRGEAALKEFIGLSRHFGFNLNPNIQIKKLTIGERQQLELIRLFKLGVRGLILDEPTSGISELQKKSLFEALRKFVEDGRCVILVSHKIEDIEALCDKVTILRKGMVNGEMKKPFIREKILEMMFGATTPPPPRPPLLPGKTILFMDQVSAPGGRNGLKDCTAHIKQNEIIGLAGLEGSGQDIFLRCAAGLVRPVKGAIFLNDFDMKGKNYHHFNKNGITFLPAARLGEGLIRGMTVSEHVALKIGAGHFFVPKKEAISKSFDCIRQYHIQGTAESMVDSLSGGNQQRFLLSLLPENPDLLLLENPTRGLDVESVNWVWKQLHTLCETKTSIVFSSSDLEEMLRVSERIFVFFNGRLIKNFVAEKTDIHELGKAVSGLS